MALNLEDCRRIAAEIVVSEASSPFDVWSPRTTLSGYLVLPDGSRTQFPDSAIPFVLSERPAELNLWLPQDGRVLVTNNPRCSPTPPRPGLQDAGFSVVDVTILDYLERDELQQLLQRFGRAFGEYPNDPPIRL